jgi:capsular polysaccharide biosynthesis protein
VTRWNIDQELSGSGSPTQSLLFSLHFFRAALLRRWRTLACCICGGALLAIAALHALPPGSSATTGLVLAHREDDEPATAMATDVSLLRTRAVAQKAADALHLPMSPDDFQATVTVTAPTPEILLITLKAPTPDEAVARLGAFSTAFMAFRSTQVRTQSDGVIAGDQEQIKDLQGQSETLTKQYEAVADRSDPDSQSQAADLLTQRSQLNAVITTLQQDIKQTSLVTESILAASHTIDAPALNPPHTAKRVVLVMMSGLIGGTAVGVGLVLVTALLSRRLRRRDEVAMALGRPVRFSTRALVHRWPRRGVARMRDVDVLAAGLGTALTQADGPQSLALVSVGATREAALVVRRLAERLEESDHRVCLVDLTEHGDLAGTRGAGAGIAVVRPTGTVATAAGPISLVSSYDGRASLDEDARVHWDRAEVVLVLGDAELGVGAEPLSTWADQAVFLVKAGRVSAEFLDSLSRIFNASGVTVDFAMLVGTDWSDESPGFPAALASGLHVRRSS